MGALHGMQVALAQLGLEATRFKRTSACAPELAGSTAREDSFGVKDYFKKHNEEISPNTAETPLSSLIFIFIFFCSAIVPQVRFKDTLMRLCAH